MLARIVSGSVLLYTGVSGLTRFPGEFRDSETLLQQLAGVGVLGYGIAGTAAALLLLVRHRRTVPAALAWAVAATVTGGLAPVAFGGSPPWVGLLGALVSAAVAGAVVWLARYGLARPDIDPPPPSRGKRAAR